LDHNLGNLSTKEVKLKTPESGLEPQHMMVAKKNGRIPNISSSPNERKLLNGNNTLQIKREENVNHTIERIEGMHNIDASGQLTHSQATSSSVS
jgi:hypothetical protein